MLVPISIHLMSLWPLDQACKNRICSHSISQSQNPNMSQTLRKMSPQWTWQGSAHIDPALLLPLLSAGKGIQVCTTEGTDSKNKIETVK